MPEQEAPSPKKVFSHKPAKKLGRHFAHYGNVKLVRDYCRSCRTYALVIENVLQCCSRELERETRLNKRMSQPAQRRALPSKAERQRLIALFENGCAYCGRGFGTICSVGGKKRRLTMVWDHNLPHAFCQDNRDSNFLPACQLCNSWKSSHVFRTIDEARVFLRQKWDERQW